MRGILFRGKRDDNAEWVHGRLLSTDVIVPEFQYYHVQDNKIIDIEENGHFTAYIVTPETVGQYTGLRDKTGKMIFEGDVISACLDKYFPKNETRIVIQWNEYGFFGFNLRYSHYTESQLDSIRIIPGMNPKWLETMESDFVEKFAVVGNIYDNPELLEGDWNVSTCYK